MHGAQSKYARKLPIGLLFATLTLTAAVPVFGAGGCAETIPMAAGERLQEWVDEPGESICYRLDAEPGVLLFAAQTPLVAPAEPKVRLRGQTGDGNAAALAVPPTPAQLVLRVAEPTALVFEVAPQDPGTALGEHTVISRFVAEANAELFEIDREFSRPWTKEGVELDPVALTARSEAANEKRMEFDRHHSWPWTKEGVELDPVALTEGSEVGSDDAFLAQIHQPGLLISDAGGILVHRGDELRFRVSEDSRLTLHFYGFCSTDMADDHDALLACGTPINAGKSVPGELTRGSTSDRDAFFIVLTEQQIVWIKTESDTAIAGAFYNEWGQRLAVADNVISDQNGGDLRFVRALGPGRYSLVIDGLDIVGGAYRLHFQTSSW